MEHLRQNQFELRKDENSREGKMKQTPEVGRRKEKLQEGTTTRSFTPIFHPTPQPLGFYPQPFLPKPQNQRSLPVLSQEQGNLNQRGVKKSQSRPIRDPIPIPCGQLLSHLIQSSLVAPISLGPARTPPPPGYDPDAQCEYHKGARGHSIESCWSFKNKVRELINNKRMVFEEDNPGAECEYHTGTIGHAVEECKSFRNKLQRLTRKEDPIPNGSTQRSGKEVVQEFCRPIRIRYHKEKVEFLVDKMSLSSDNHVETMISREEMEEKSKGVVSAGETSKSHLGEHHTDTEEDDDIHLWIPKGQPTIPMEPCQKPWIAPYANQRAYGRGNQDPRQNQNRPHNNLGRRNAPRHPVPVSHTQLLPHLIRNSLVEPKSLKPVPEPYPPGYDPNAHCGYHAGSMGHSTEDCKAFQARVQQLIDEGCISFQEGSLVVRICLAPE